MFRKSLITIFVMVVLGLGFGGCEEESSNDNNWHIPIVEWSDKYGLNLPRTKNGLKTVEGIIAQGSVAYSKNTYVRDYPNDDVSNYYFSNTEGNKISSIPQEIENLSNIRYLNLNSNKIRDISMIGKLTNIRKLYLSRNSVIRDISSLKSLTALTNLSLIFNNLSDISSLKSLKKLKFLDLRWNRHINDYDIDEIKKLLPYCDINY